MIKTGLQILAILIASRLATPRIVFKVPAAIILPAFDNCGTCRQGANDAWFYGYESARACDYPVDQCIAAGDRARACYIRTHWSMCESCGGMIPEESECGQ